MHPISKVIHGDNDVFAGIAPAATGQWQTGWGGDSPLLVEMVARVRPDVIIEVGSWLGDSAINMANACYKYGVPTAGIVCVDTWLGSAEHRVDPAIMAEMELRNGRPTLYEAFLANVLAADMEENIVPFPISSEAGALALDFWHVKADLIYLDASHELSLVLLDLIRYREALLNPGGIILGHDFEMPGVKAAVTQYCTERQLKFEVEQGCWIIGRER